MTSAARRYHETTKHTWDSVRRGGRILDYATRPHPFKEYTDEPEPVPTELDRLLKLGAGVVRTREYDYGTYHFRTFSSAGGLYPVELYVATDEGLFHYHPLEHALRRLRGGRVARGTVLVLTGVLWRTAWKYGARGYRHVWWDAGTLAANLLWLEPTARLVTAFVDDDVDRLVGADGRREFAAALVALGDSDLVARSHELGPIEQELPPFPREEEFPLVHEVHEATRLRDEEAVRARRVRASEPLSPPARLDEALRRRGSVRDFAIRSVPREELADLYAEAMGPVASDAPPLTRIAAIANAVDRVPPGAYDFAPRAEFGRVRDASRALAQQVTLEQELGGRASAVAWLFADLGRVLSERGDRGYREAQLEAGVRAGRLQVGAVARGWGATASTFYDDEVRAAFATDDEPMLCVAIGRR